jgi:hypothetical protein
MLNKIKEAEKTPDRTPAGPRSGTRRWQRVATTPDKASPRQRPHAHRPTGSVGGGAGLGPRNNATGVNKGGGVSNQKSKRTGDQRRWQDVWTDRLPKTRKNIDRITGKLGDSGEMEQLPPRPSSRRQRAHARTTTFTKATRKTRKDAVAKDAVPPAYKQPVKDYFESLKP